MNSITILFLNNFTLLDSITNKSTIQDWKFSLIYICVHLNIFVSSNYSTLLEPKLSPQIYNLLCIIKHHKQSWNRYAHDNRFFCMQSLPAMIYRSKPRSSASYGGRKIKDAHGNYIVEACTIISKVRDLTRVGSQRESWLIIRDPRERRRRSRRALK